MSSRLGRTVTAPLMWLFDPLVRPADTSDLVAFAAAEDHFDLGDRLGDIAAPTLVIAGGRDPVYPADVVAATATRVQRGTLITYPRTGHGGILTHRRFTRDVASFLAAD